MYFANQWIDFLSSSNSGGVSLVHSRSVSPWREEFSPSTCVHIPKANKISGLDRVDSGSFHAIKFNT